MKVIRAKLQAAVKNFKDKVQAAAAAFHAPRLVFIGRDIERLALVLEHSKDFCLLYGKKVPTPSGEDVVLPMIRKVTPKQCRKIKATLDAWV